MKVLVVIFALCVAGTLGGLTEEQTAKLKAYKEACIAESGVDPVLVENAKKGEVAQDDEKLHCFAACLLRHIGILDAEGRFHEDVVRAKLPAEIPSEKADAVISSCKSLTGNSVCQKGGAMFVCFLKTKSFNLL